MRTQIKVNQEPVKNQQRKNSPKRAFDLYRVEIILYYFFSDNQSIDCRRSNPSRISSSFPTRIDATNIGLECFLISTDTDDGRAPSLDRDEECFWISETMDLVIEIPESDLQCLGDEVWETLFDRGHLDTWEIGSRDSVTLYGGTIREKVSNQLSRSMVVGSSKDKCFRFPLALEFDTCEWMIRAKVVRRDRDHEGRVGYSTILAVLTHPIDTESPILRRGSDHMTTRTHTERVDRTSVSTMSDELIARRSELGTHTRITELRSIDHIRIVFDPHSHREWLLDNIESLVQDHLIGITSRVSDREDQRVTLYPLITIDDDRCSSPINNLYVSHTSTKANFRTKREYLLSQFSHEDTELVRSDMGLRLVHDLLRCSGRHHLLEHILAARIIDHGVEFSIGECSRSPFSVLDIGVFVECPPFHEHPHIDESSLYSFASIDDERIESSSGQCQSCKKPSWTSTHDDWAFSRRVERNNRYLIDELLDILCLMLEEMGLGEVDIFLLEIDVDTIDKKNSMFIS